MRASSLMCSGWCFTTPSISRRLTICTTKFGDPSALKADAKWLLDAEGYELAHFGFNAVLRDYARLGRLLAHDGAWEGKQIIPSRWMIDATKVRPSDAYLRPGRATKLSATATCCGCSPVTGVNSRWSVTRGSTSVSIRFPSL
jgi:CubicO group peptidase (beta-lactamase class C family)